MLSFFLPPFFYFSSFFSLSSHFPSFHPSISLSSITFQLKIFDTIPSYHHFPSTTTFTNYNSFHRCYHHLKPLPTTTTTTSNHYQLQLLPSQTTHHQPHHPTNHTTNHTTLAGQPLEGTSLGGVSGGGEPLYR